MGTKNGGIQLTAEEQAEHEVAQAATQAAIASEAIVETARQAKKASGKQKLKDIGLDDEEIKALIGI